MRGLLVTLVVILVAWFWSSSLRARESALQTGAGACKSMGLQFLDDTVVLRRIGLGRNDHGRLMLQRVYGFEFSTDGTHRHRGQIAMQSSRITAVHLDHPDGPVVLQPGELER